MKQKIVAVLSLVILFSVVFGTQIASTASAEAKNNHPLTSPLTFFQINGTVTYKFFRLFGKSADRFTPAPDVTISAENLFSHDSYKTSTDNDGNYSLSVEEKGIYLVSPSGGQTHTYVPPVQVVTANNKGMKNHVDFQGYLLP